MPAADERHHSPAVRVTWLSFGLNVALGLVKCAGGYLGQSRALIADGIHSVTDLGTDAAVLFGLRFAAQPPDASHPYGHHRLANLVSLFIAASIIGFCVLLIADSARALRSAEIAAPHWPTLAIGLASLAVKEWLFRRTRRIGRKLKSQMLLTNAWHHRTDSISSLVAVLGIAAAIALGPAWAFLDTLVGMILGGYLALEGGKLLYTAARDLIDTAPERSVVDDLREHILTVRGAVAYHNFRARRVGDMIELDFHLLVPPELSIGEAHDVATRVKQHILDRHPEVIHVLVHVEPALPEHHRESGVSGGDIETAAPSQRTAGTAASPRIDERHAGDAD